MSGWDKVKKVIGTVAPSIATALGGPLAGQAISVITGALGLGPTEEEKAIQVISQSPDALLKLKLAEIDFQKFLTESGIKLEELDVQREKIATDDRASARNLGVVRGLAPQITLSFAYTCGYFMVLIGLMTGVFHVWEEGHDLLLGLVGALSAGQVQILNYWFGSSSGSVRSSQMLHELSNNVVDFPRRQTQSLAKAA